MARGAVFFRCPCGTSGTRGRPACKKRHGTWWWRASLGKDSATAKRRQPAQGGYATRGEAQEALTEFLSRVDRGTVVADQGLTVGAWLDRWLTEVAATLEPSTVNGYRSHVTSYLKPALGHLRLRDLRRQHVEAMLTDLGAPRAPVTSRIEQVYAVVAGHPDAVRRAIIRDALDGAAVDGFLVQLRQQGRIESPRRGLYRAVPGQAAPSTAEARPAGRGGRYVEHRSPRTIDAIRRTLRAALGTAQRRGLVALNPAEGRMDSIPRIGRADTTWWQPDQLRAFLDIAQGDPWSALWTVAAFTGLRRGELAGVRWSDLDLTGETPGLTVNQRVVSIPGPQMCPVCSEEHRGRRIRVGAKTDSGRRWVPLTSDCVGELLAHRAQQDVARQPWGDDYSDHQLVFAREDGSPIQPDDITVRHHELARAAGLPAIRLHDMRHGAASLLLAGGVPVEIVALILGHASPAVTRGVYAHVLKAPAAAGMEAAAALVRSDARAQPVHSLNESDDSSSGGDTTN